MKRVDYSKKKKKSRTTPFDVVTLTITIIATPTAGMECLTALTIMSLRAWQLCYEADSDILQGYLCW